MPTPTATVLVGYRPITATPVPTPTRAQVRATPTPTPIAEPRSLAGNVILYAQGGSLKSSPHRAVFDRPEMETVYHAAAGGEGHTIYLSLDALTSSPDGRWVAANDPLPSGPEVQQSGTTWLADLVTGELRSLGSPAVAVTWSPDSRCLTYAREDAVYVLDLASGGESTAIFRQPGTRMLAARWSPTGEWIAVASTGQAFSEESVLTHWIASPDGGTVVELGAIPLPRTQWSASAVEWAADGSLFATYGGVLFTLDGEQITCCGSTDDLPTSLPPALDAALRLLDVEGEFAWIRSVSHSGSRIAYGNVYVFDQVSQTHTLVGEIADWQVSEIRWSADDSTLIVGVTRWQDMGFWGAIYALQPQSGSVPELLVEGKGVYLLDVIPDVSSSPTPAPPNAFTSTPTATQTPTPTSTPFVPPTPLPMLPPMLSPEVKPLAVLFVSGWQGGVAGYDRCPLAWSPDGYTVAYVQGDSIWTLRAPQYDPIRLVQIPDGRLNDLRWSPDGQRLAVHGWLPYKNASGDYIWIVGTDTGGAVRLEPRDICFHPHSPKILGIWLDVQTLTVECWRAGLVRVNVQWGDVTWLLTGGNGGKLPVKAVGGPYYWSPTRTHLVVDNDYQLALVDVQQGTERWLVRSGEWPGGVFLGWSGDGGRFLYSKWNFQTEQFDLHLWAIGREQEQTLLAGVQQASLSPDGKRAAFLQIQDRPSQLPARIRDNVSPEQWPPALTLGILDVNTGQTTMLGPVGYVPIEGSMMIHWRAGLPVWSPDSRWVACWGEEGDVWLASADGTWQTRLTQSLDVGQILWSPDGTRLALRAGDRVWIVEHPQASRVGESPTPTPLPEDPIDTTAWPTCYASSLGFSIRYPPGWEAYDRVDSTGVDSNEWLGGGPLAMLLTFRFDDEVE